jgi:hypothetical protein
VSHRPTPDTERIDDEAIIEIDAEILKIEPPQPQHLGQQISWSIVCARSFHRGENARRAGEVPLLYSVTLRKNARSLLAYLPADAFWAMLARLETGKLNYIEACYQKPSRGFAELTSLHFFRCRFRHLKGGYYPVGGTVHVAEATEQQLSDAAACSPEEQTAIKFPGFSTDRRRMFALCSARYCRLGFWGLSKSLINQGFSGGRTRDRTLDLSRVKGTLSR